MILRRHRMLRLTVLATFVLVSLASPAFAAPPVEEKPPPYDVDGMEHAKVWVPWVAAFLFLAGGLSVAFKNPHRGTTERA